jgi:hypothetical protein
MGVSTFCKEKCMKVLKGGIVKESIHVKVFKGRIQNFKREDRN